MVTMQKKRWLMFELNFNFVLDVLKKIALDLNMFKKNCRFWTIATREGTKRSQGNKMKRTRTRKDDRMEA